jgi:hypothetical protein
MSGAPGPAYDLQRSLNKPVASQDEAEASLDYSSNLDNDSSYYHDGAGSSITGLAAAHVAYHNDATETVRAMHLALLYLLSNPEEFKKALHAHPPRGATTLAEWNAEYEEDDESVATSATASTPLPFVVFADDAEVVLPQAHTASQLFGIEKVEGIELEAAAGIRALSQLFMRWLGKQLYIYYYSSTCMYYSCIREFIRLLFCSVFYFIYFYFQLSCQVVTISILSIRQD